MHKLTAKFQLIASSKKFRCFIMCLIVLAGVLVGLETYPSVMDRYGELIYLIDYVIIMIFVVEMVIRIGAHGSHPLRFFQDAWNVFDFVIVFVCLLPLHAEFVAVFRMVRVLRILRLVTALPRLQMLVGALLKSIPSIGYISILLLLHFYIYACIGTFLFGQNDPLHFGNLHTAMLTLFQIVTLEGWIDVMYIQIFGSDSWAFESYQIKGTNPMGRPVIAPIYFISFILFGTMIILNLFIGVIMGGMAEMQAEQEARELDAKRVADKLTLADEVHLLVKNMDSIQSQLLLIRKRLDLRANGN